MGHPVQQSGVQPVGDAVVLQGLIDHAPVQLLPLADRGEGHHPGIDLVGGDVEPGAGVQAQRLLFRLFLLLFAVLAPGPALGGFQPGAAQALQRRLQAAFLLFQKLRRKHAVLVHAQTGRGQGKALLPAEVMKLADGMIRGNLQLGAVLRDGLRRLDRGLLGDMLLGGGE